MKDATKSKPSARKTAADAGDDSARLKDALAALEKEKQLCREIQAKLDSERESSRLEIEALRLQTSVSEKQTAMLSQQMSGKRQDLWPIYAARLLCSARYRIGVELCEALLHPKRLFKMPGRVIKAYRHSRKIPLMAWPGGAMPSDDELEKLALTPVGSSNSGKSSGSWSAGSLGDDAPPVSASLLAARRARAREQGKTYWLLKCPSPRLNRTGWGDYHFCESLKTALEARGQYVELQFHEDWDEPDEADIVLVLRGLYSYTPARNKGQIYIMWNISHPEDVSDEEYNRYDLVFIASRYYAGMLAKRLTVPVYPMLQCTDTRRFYETEEELAQAQETPPDDIVFVGNSRIAGRPCVNWAVQRRCRLKIWGSGWYRMILDSERYVVADSIGNDQIRDLFVHARATLNDHWATMLTYRFINNRIFDALACGLPVITDFCDELRELFPDELLYYNDQASFNACIKELDEHYEDVKARVEALKPRIRREFSFDTRAGEFIDVVKKHFPDKGAQPEKHVAGEGSWDVVFFWKQNDTGLFGRRSDMVMKYLERDPRIRRIVSFDRPVTEKWLKAHTPSKNEPPFSRDEYLVKKARLRQHGDRVSDKLVQYNMIIPRGGRYKAKAYEKYIRDVLRKEGVGERKTLMWVCPVLYEFEEACHAVAPDMLIADAIDDEREFTQRDDFKAKITRNYQTIFSWADFIFCNCDAVHQMIARMCPAQAGRVFTFPNAMERVEDPLRPEAVPQRMADIPHPIIGYAGNISSKFDVELVDYLSSQRPDWQFVFIGSAHLDQRLQKLESRRNIHLLNVVPYDELPAYIKQFDVAIMPHLTDAQSEKMNPLKLFVYAAYRKRIVTSKVPNIGEVGDLARVAESREEFLQMVEESLHAGVPESSEAYDAFVSENSWEKRVAGMLDIALQ